MYPALHTHEYPPLGPTEQYPLPLHVPLGPLAPQKSGHWVPDRCSSTLFGQGKGEKYLKQLKAMESMSQEADVVGHHCLPVER